jgi:5-methylcytosine-specific restriction endonuclease McrA
MIQVDHIIPVGKFISFDDLIDKLFCDINNLTILCLNCHKAKTLTETKLRKTK